MRRLIGSLAATVVLVLPLAGIASRVSDGEGWVELFNGKDLTGWKAFLPGGEDPAKTWSVADGILTCNGNPAGYIQTDKDYTSFELELDWRFNAAKGAGNSGVLMRINGADKVWPNSIEAQLHSLNAGDIWNIGDFPMVTDKARTEGRRTKKASETNEKPLGEWNHYRIVLDGGNLKMFVNGELQNEATGCAATPGRIGLQSEGSYIQFRHIRLKSLEKAAPAAAPAAPVKK